MNAAQERLSGHAASLEIPCSNCSAEARVLGTTMCAPCLSAASYVAMVTIASDEWLDALMRGHAPHSNEAAGG